MKKKKPAPQGFERAKSITRKYATSFYWASFFLAPVEKSAAYAVYAICRMSDEAADSSVSGPAKKQRRIKEIINNINKAYNADSADNGLLSAFQQTVNNYKIPREYFSILLEGMKSDLYKTRYNNFSELYDYCYKAAGVVGLMMLKIMGCSGKKAEQHAVELAIAMQLTNILRDIKEDFLRGRVYLPQDEMKIYGVSEETIAAGFINENFKELMKFQIKRAREYYTSSYAGIPLLKNLRHRLLVLTMQEMYSGILSAIDKKGFDVFTQRLYLNTGDKLNHLCRALKKGIRTYENKYC